jgi:hypothetical protein
VTEVVGVFVRFVRHSIVAIIENSEAFKIADKLAVV